MAFLADPLPLAIGCERDTPASGAVEAVVRAGARLLAAEPWRVGRIIRGADALTLQELAAEVARRGRLPPAKDFNRALALKQLTRALQQPEFIAGWSAWRANAESPGAGGSTHSCLTQRKLAASSTSPPT
jgi:hypothetical protein